MALVQNDVTLSRLGQAAAASKDLAMLFTILRDLWDPEHNPGGYVNIGAAENALMHAELSQYIAQNFTCQEQFLTYGDGGMGTARLRKAIAKFLNRHFKTAVPLEASHMVVTNGVSSAVEHCAFLLSDPGDVWLLGQPYYTTFLADLSLRPGTQIIPVAFGDVDPLSIECVGRYEAAIIQARRDKKRVKGLMLCHPHNPLGRCYAKQVVIELMRLCQAHSVHFVSDEIYGLSVWTNDVDIDHHAVPFESALSIDLTDIIDPRRVHVLWGLSKDFGSNGLRMGAVISQHNQEFLEALETCALYSYPSSLTDHVAAKLLEDDQFTDSYLVHNRLKLASNYRFAVTFLREHEIEYAPGGNAAFFLWLNLGQAYNKRLPADVVDDARSTAIMERLLDTRVFCSSGKAFGSERPGWFRLVFARPQHELAEGLRRIVATLDSFTPNARDKAVDQDLVDHPSSPPSLVDRLRLI